MLETLRDAGCASLLGPPLPGMTMAGGARIPGTSLELDPAQAAFSLGLLLRWSGGDDRRAPGDFRGHPHDTLGALLALFDHRARAAVHAGQAPPTVRDLLLAYLGAMQVQSRLMLPEALDNAGLRIRVATALAAAAVLGVSAPQRHDLLAECVLDGRAPERAQRRWFVADAGARGLWLALSVARRGESELSTERQPLELAPEPAVAEGTVPDATVTTARLHAAVATHFTPRQAARIVAGLADPRQLDALRVSEFIARFVRNA